MKQRVLVVDDEMYICHIVRLVLEEAGYEVLEANTAESGLKILKESIPDALTVDLIMPGLKDPEFGGLDLLEEKQLDSSIRDIPSLLLTAAGMRAENEIERALEIGARTTLRKPFSQRQLIEAVRGLLDESFPSSPKQEKQQ